MSKNEQDNKLIESFIYKDSKKPSEQTKILKGIEEYVKRTDLTGWIPDTSPEAALVFDGIKGEMNESLTEIVEIQKFIKAYDEKFAPVVKELFNEIKENEKDNSVQITCGKYLFSNEVILMMKIEVDEKEYMVTFLNTNENPDLLWSYAGEANAYKVYKRAKLLLKNKDNPNNDQLVAYSFSENAIITQSNSIRKTIEALRIKAIAD